MLCDWFLPRLLSERSKRKHQFIELVMEGSQEPIRFFARVDKIVGVLRSLGVHLRVKDVNLNIVEVLNAEYEFEKRKILYRDNIIRAVIK